MSFLLPKPADSASSAGWSLPAASLLLLSSEATNQLTFQADVCVHRIEAISCCAERDHPQLTQPRVFHVMVDAIKHYIAAQRWWMNLFLAMPDHCHALVSFQDIQDMPAAMRDWKRYVAKQTGIVWQDGFFDHRLRSSESTTDKWNYILLNPVRKGLVPKPEDWRFMWTPPTDSAR